jgi:FKBP-type peptidyl-prolyl cis-trans isomerase FkpA
MKEFRMKHFMRLTLMATATVAALCMTVAADAQVASSAAPKVDKAKASYVVGWDLAGQLPPLVRKEIDPTIVANAVKDALEGKHSSISETEAKQIRQDFVAMLRAEAKAEYNLLSEKNKKEGDGFLSVNKTKPGVKTTASGLEYQIIAQGAGPRPGPKDTVEVDYTGTFVNGKVFDASAKHEGGGPAAISLGDVIPGFREGLELMQVGGHYKLFIPSGLAYGPHPRNGFPPNATIIFDVKLVKTTAPKTTVPGK